MCYPNRESQKNFNGVHKTSKVKVVANVRFMQLRPDLQAGHLSEGSRDLKAWWSKRHSWSWKALGKKFMLTRLGDKWKDPWWFLWEGCEKEVKCKPLRKQKREYKKRTVFSDVILQLQLNPSSTALGIEESDCCKEVAVVPSAKNVAVRREVAVHRSSTVISETQTFNPYAFLLFLDIAFLAFALSIFVTSLMFSAFALWKIITKRYYLGQSVKMKHCRMKNYWRRTLLLIYLLYSCYLPHPLPALFLAPFVVRSVWLSVLVLCS